MKTNFKNSNTKQVGGYTPRTEMSKKIKQAETESAVRAKLDQVKYVKVFDNFKTGMNEMINLSDDVCDLLRDVPGDWSNIEGAMDVMLKVFTDHMPSISDRTNMHYDISLSANKCSLKTDKYIAFGWYAKVNRNEDNTISVSYIFHIIVFGDKKEALIRDISNAGWTVDTYKK
jgi:hypothetical protein